MDLDNCTICLEPLDVLIRRLPCGHMFHDNCLKPTILNCPICRENIKPFCELCKKPSNRLFIFNSYNKGICDLCFFQESSKSLHFYRNAFLELSYKQFDLTNKIINIIELLENDIYEISDTRTAILEQLKTLETFIKSVYNQI
jgi:hypothetical protein